MEVDTSVKDYKLPEKVKKLHNTFFFSKLFYNFYSEMLFFVEKTFLSLLLKVAPSNINLNDTFYN